MFVFFNGSATTEIYTDGHTLSLHDALPIWLVGVGLTLMGFCPSRPFRRTAESRRPEVAWLFDGVEGEVFGTEGIVLGAAAGYEVDCTNARLGTPPETVVIATAAGFGPDSIGDAGMRLEAGAAEARKSAGEGESVSHGLELG